VLQENVEHFTHTTFHVVVHLVVHEWKTDKYHMSYWTREEVIYIREELCRAAYVGMDGKITIWGM